MGIAAQTWPEVCRKCTSNKLYCHMVRITISTSASLLLSSLILIYIKFCFSGQTYAQVSKLFDTFGLGLFGKTIYYKYQNALVAQVVENEFQNSLANAAKQILDKGKVWSQYCIFMLTLINAIVVVTYFRG